MQQHGIAPIDMVVVNLTRAAQTNAREGCSLAARGGKHRYRRPDSWCALAAKNHKDVAIVVEQRLRRHHYEMDANEGSSRWPPASTSPLKPSTHTAAYDSMIAGNSLAAWLFLGSLSRRKQRSRWPLSRVKFESELH